MKPMAYASMDFDRPTMPVEMNRSMGAGKFALKWLSRIGDWDDETGTRTPEGIVPGLVRLAQWARQ